MNHPDPKYLAALARVANVPIILQLDIVSVFHLVGLLQLALRHPDITPDREPAKTAREFIADFAMQVGEREPLIAELVEMGNTTQHDAPPSNAAIQQTRRTALLDAAREVATHWNDSSATCNQKAQAERSASALRRMADEAK